MRRNCVCELDPPRYRAEGEYSPLELVRWVAEKHPAATNSRILWMVKVYDRLFELYKVDVGDSHEQRLTELGRNLVPSPESLLRAMRKAERYGFVKPPDPSVGRFHERQRRSAPSKNDPVICHSCEKAVRSVIREGHTVLEAR